MSLYGNFTLKEWLALHCTTKDVDELFRKALKNNDEPMAVLALAELIKRGDIDLVTDAIREAIDTGCFAIGSNFSTFFANALTQCGNRVPILRRIGKNVRQKGFWPETAAELFDNTDSANYDRSTLQKPDNRLDKFLKGFILNGGRYSIEFGFLTPDTKWDLQTKDDVEINSDGHFYLSISDGFIMHSEEIHNVLRILDVASIREPLPALEKEDLNKKVIFYTLEDGNWVDLKEAKEDNYFYMGCLRLS